MGAYFSLDQESCDSFSSPEVIAEMLYSVDPVLRASEMEASITASQGDQA